MASITYTILALLPVFAWYLYAQIKQWRFRKYAHIPHALPTTLALGHLKSIAEGFKKLGDGRRHVGLLDGS